MAERRRRYAMLTGGGDCPGLNAVIRAAARRCMRRGVTLIGYRNGWEGVISGRSLVLDRQAVRGILPLGGTILGTSRTDPLRVPRGSERIFETLDTDRVEGVIVVGGDGTLSAASELQEASLRVVAVPKAIDRLHTTAEAHKRVIVVEVMGHHAGWIAAYAGIAGGADVILVPEYPFDSDAVCERIAERERRGSRFSIVVLAEGARPDGRSTAPEDRRARVRPGEISDWLAREIERCIDTETRTVVLRGTRVTAVPLREVVDQVKTLDPIIWEVAKAFT